DRGAAGWGGARARRPRSAPPARRPRALAWPPAVAPAVARAVAGRAWARAGPAALASPPVVARALAPGRAPGRGRSKPHRYERVSLPVPPRQLWQIYTTRARFDTARSTRKRRRQRTLRLGLQLPIVLVGGRKAQETDSIGASEAGQRAVCHVGRLGSEAIHLADDRRRVLACSHRSEDL